MRIREVSEAPKNTTRKICCSSSCFFFTKKNLSDNSLSISETFLRGKKYQLSYQNSPASPVPPQI